MRTKQRKMNMDSSACQEHGIGVRLLVGFLSFLLTFMPLTSYAAGTAPAKNDMSQVGKDAQAFGQEILNGMGSPSGENGSLNLNYGMQGGTSFNQSINTNELFPGTSSTNTSSASEFFPDEHLTTEQMQGVSDSSDSMGEKGKDSKNSLYKDAMSEKPSTTGSAYKVLLDSKDKTGGDFNKNDPMMQLTLSTLSDLDNLTEDFGDCSIDEKIVDTTTKGHIPDYQQCSIVTDKSGKCDVTHNYSASIIRHYDGPFNMQSCGPDCKQIWIGKVGDNYWAGNCKIYEEYTQVKVDNPEAITSAIFDRAQWDDYMQVWVGERGHEKKIWSGPNNNFPPETAGACELSTSWSKNPGVDVTQYFKNVEPGSIITFKIRVSVTGNGEGYGRITIHYDPNKAVTVDDWTPQSCIDAATGLSDGFASGNVACTEMPIVTNGNCTDVDGTTVCTSGLKPSPIKGVSPLCKKVSVTANYDFYKGSMDCYVDANGNQQCPTNNGGNTDGCAKFANDKQCGFIKEDCVDGAKGASGTCYVKERTYDCGSDVAIPDQEVKTNYDCEGPISCMGDECLNVDKEKSGSFTKALALLNAAQFMTQDMQCDGLDGGAPTGEENVTCKVFAGTPGECKTAVGGTQNCCEKPHMVSMGDYLTMVMAIPKLDAGIMKLKDGNMVKGAYQHLREPVMEGWQTVTKPIHSYIENITGKIDAIKEGVKNYTEKAIDAMEKKVSAMIEKIMGNGTDQALENAAASGAEKAGQKVVENQGKEEAKKTMAQSIMNGGAAVLGVVNAIYTAYVVTTIAISMIYKCTEDELQVNAQREMEQCTYVGSYCKSKVLGACIEKRQAYCCFNSPLSRIVQEQVKKVKGESFGSAKNPQCGGIPLTEVQDIDWDKIDLSEWTALLQKNGKLPDPKSLSIESLTGAGTALDVDGNRDNSVERIQERMNGIDVYEKHDEAGDMIPIDTGAPQGN